MNTALICIVLLGLLVFVLGFAVSSVRAKTETNFGASDDPTDILHKVVRSHGNTIEYAPMLALLIYLVGSRSPAGWAIACMWIATVSRYLIATGLIVSPSLDKPHPLRFLGALGTYLSGIALCLALATSI